HEQEHQQTDARAPDDVERHADKACTIQALSAGTICGARPGDWSSSMSSPVGLTSRPCPVGRSWTVKFGLRIALRISTHTAVGTVRSLAPSSHSAGTDRARNAG